MIGDDSAQFDAEGNVSDGDRARYFAAQVADLRAEMAALHTEFRRELTAQRVELSAELSRLRYEDELDKGDWTTSLLLGLGIPITISLSILLGYSLGS